MSRFDRAAVAAALTRVELPCIACAGCRTQLVRYLFADLDGALVCLFCARDRDSGSVRSVSPDAHGFLSGVEAMPEPDAVDLLRAAGATVVGPPALRRVQPPSAAALTVEMFNRHVEAGETGPAAFQAAVVWVCGYSSAAEVGVAVRALVGYVEELES